MLLRHYSAVPFVGPIRRVEQDRVHFKPNGLWVSVDDCEDNWKAWCEREQWELDRLAYSYDVTLSIEARILLIKDKDGLRALTKQIGMPEHVHCTQMRWHKIASNYDGIIIAPYIWECRLEIGLDWYYSWDCASGCVWEPSAVESILATEER